MIANIVDRGFRSELDSNVSSNSIKDTKVQGISFHIFQSYLFGLVLKTTLCTFTAILVAPISPILSTLCVGVGIVDFLRLHKELIFEISLLFTIATSKCWWNPISEHIVLGAIPLRNHLKPLIELKVDAILTMLESFELKDGLVKPISPNHWKSRKVETLHIPAQDFFGVQVEHIEQAVQYIRDQVINGKKVYVHCKAGRGRSASVVIAYLMKFGISNKQFSSFEEAYSFVKELRPQIRLGYRQKATIQKWLNEKKG